LNTLSGINANAREGKIETYALLSDNKINLENHLNNFDVLIYN
jgi:hypothetical protein